METSIVAAFKKIKLNYNVEFDYILLHQQFLLLHLQMHAVCLSKSRKKGEALQMFEEYKYGETESEITQYLQTALIELLIIQACICI